MLGDSGVATNSKAKKLLRTVEYGWPRYCKEGLIILNDRACQFVVHQVGMRMM